MTPQRQRPVRLFPIGSLRAAMLTLTASLAFLEVGSGAVVAEAWRGRRNRGTWNAVDAVRLDDLLNNLRSLTISVALGSVVLTMLWSFVAVTNVRIAARSSRSAVFTALAWLIAPALLVGLATFGGSTGILHLAMFLLAGEAVVMYLPFGLLGGAAEQVGGKRSPFRRWYLAAVLAFVVHRVFTSAIDLASPGPADDLGRTAAMFFVNGMVVGMMVLMAADASRSLQAATADKAFHHNHIEDDAALRFELKVPRPASAGQGSG